MMRSKKLSVLVIGLFFGVSAICSAQSKMDFKLSFTQPEAHYAEVQFTCSELLTPNTSFMLPVWSPGYYKILDFPRYVVDFQVKNDKGEMLDWHKESKDTWVVNNGTNQSIVVTYRVFANKKSVAESLVDQNKAFIMPNSMFMYPKDKIDVPVTLKIEPYQDWNAISTGLVKNDAGQYNAPDFDVLYDSPIYIGNQKIIEFEHDGRPYHLAMETPEGLQQDTFVDDLKKVISATTALMGHVPYQNYCFIMMGAGGGGLEHWNSQAVFTSGSFEFKSKEHYTDFLNFITHEYFHLYNVKAIRPIALGPFDYGKENYTDMLWVSEGITVYYEYLIMLRAGLLQPKEALDYLSGSIRRYENIEGKNHMSLSRSSFDIWLNFLNRDENTDQTTISYYNKGPIIGLLLDLEIRKSSKNQKSLDDVMQFLYNKYFLKQKRGFTKEEFWAICEQFAGKSLLELQNYVDTVNEIDYQKYLDHAGLQIDLSPLEEGTSFIKRSYQLSEKEKATKEQLMIKKSLLYPISKR
ncbi:M61 family metallopeptidase [Allomuricauda sp. M10]|uniref:M61 family metallopeptidase n=1 Tax=Allomuricauda sp. M10 TaxID=2683292 RepID=UPI001D188DB2|nr:hypothetical protein [Muricauda sp. M10]